MNEIYLFGIQLVDCLCVKYCVITYVYIHYEVHNVHVYCDNKTIKIFNNYDYSLVLLLTLSLQDLKKKNYKMFCYWKRLWFYNLMNRFISRKTKCISYFFMYS